MLGHLTFAIQDHLTAFFLFLAYFREVLLRLLPEESHTNNHRCLRIVQHYLNFPFVCKKLEFVQNHVAVVETLAPFLSRKNPFNTQSTWPSDDTRSLIAVSVPAAVGRDNLGSCLIAHLAVIPGWDAQEHMSFRPQL